MSGDRMKEEYDAWERGQKQQESGRRSCTPFNDWLACPICNKPFDRNNITKHNMGRIMESYRCGGCGLMSAKMSASDLKTWWNTRAS